MNITSDNLSVGHFELISQDILYKSCHEIYQNTYSIDIHGALYEKRTSNLSAFLALVIFYQRCVFRTEKKINSDYYLMSKPTSWINNCIRSSNMTRLTNDTPSLKKTFLSAWRRSMKNFRVGLSVLLMWLLFDFGICLLFVPFDDLIKKSYKRKHM